MRLHLDLAVSVQEQLKAKEDRLRDLKDADSRGKAIEERVVTLQAERLQLLEQTQAAEAAWSAAKEREARSTVRANLQKVVDACANSLTLRLTVLYVPRQSDAGALHIGPHGADHQSTPPALINSNTDYGATEEIAAWRSTTDTELRSSATAASRR